MSYSSSEVKSGFLITLSIVLLVVLTFIVGDYLAGDTQTWQVRFGYISGLETGAPVHYAGLEVGKVSKIEILSGEAKPILVTAAVSTQVHLREDSQAHVDTLGFMGEKFLELTAGSEKSEFLRSGTVIEGTDPIPMHEMVRKLDLLADRMDVMTESLNPLVKRLDGYLSGSEEDVAKIIANLEQTSANVRDMTNDLKYHPWRLVRKG